MHKAVFILPLVLLAACQTPREACISDASGNLPTINRLITETEGNLARGYAIGTREDVEIERDYCERTLQDGTVVQVRCDRARTVERRVPVAINLYAEQAKLDSLYERRNDLQARIAPAIQACVAAYPEE
ncbi:hypothetical protein BVG79_00698 [Ketogulonicigenium robustum]|uniref:Lipoprotein n=1 Tax=Ketogulonicigenium robustum TaxID=92947 RepID=A0A1W6NY75_9RHOB|nr:hypothetical protein [Ketogulonicigenium robustum]ARO14050.1 hypothetical protein BVG79_00698 [Ketogulonicigenium robustum]